MREVALAVCTMHGCIAVLPYALDVTFSCCRCFLSADDSADTGEQKGGATCVAGNVVMAMAAALLCIVFPAVRAML